MQPVDSWLLKTTEERLIVVDERRFKCINNNAYIPRLDSRASERDSSSQHRKVGWSAIESVAGAVPWVLTPYAQHFKANTFLPSTAFLLRRARVLFSFIPHLTFLLCSRKYLQKFWLFMSKNKKQTQNRMKKLLRKKWFFSRIAVELKSVFWIIYDINLNILVAKRLLWLRFADDDGERGAWNANAK